MYQALTFERQHLNTVQNTNIWTPLLHLPTTAPTNRESQSASWIPENSVNPRTHRNRTTFFVNQKSHCESRIPCIVNPANALWIHNCLTSNRLNIKLIPCSFSEIVNIGGGSPWAAACLFYCFQMWIAATILKPVQNICDINRRFCIFWPMREFLQWHEEGSEYVCSS